MNPRDDLTEHLPAGPRIPSVLQLLALWHRPTVTLERLRTRYGSRFTMRLPLQRPFVVLSDPDEIKELFTAPAEIVHAGKGARNFTPLFGRNSLALLDEDAHLETRKLVLPPLHGDNLRELVAPMQELAEREIRGWAADQPMALHPRFRRLSLEIILRAVLGLEPGDRLLDDLRDALMNTLAISASPLVLLPAAQRKLHRLRPFRRLESRMRDVDRLMYRLIQARPGELSEVGGRHDILSELLAAPARCGSPMSPEQLRDQLITVLIAGHETTASQLAWTVDLLAHHPAAAGQLRSELDAGNGDAYLTATITESLRRRPALLNAAPRITKQALRIGGHEYPRGVGLLASSFLVHHDPRIYPDPYAFRPERFLATPPGTYTWIPFGGGRRRCLGASFAMHEMRIILRAVLSRFELAPLSPRPSPGARRGVVFTPDNGATVILRERPRVRAAVTR